MDRFLIFWEIWIYVIEMKESKAAVMDMCIFIVVHNILIFPTSNQTLWLKSGQLNYH